MAKALVCNSCGASGKATFATVHAEGRVGVGKGARTFDADFCEEHGAAFFELVGKTRSAPPRDSDGRQVSSFRGGRGRVHVPPIRVEAAILRMLRKTKRNAWVPHKTIKPTIDAATPHQFPSAVRRLTERKMIESRRIHGSKAHELRLTAAGRKLAKDAQSDVALAKIAPIPATPETVKFALLRYIAQQAAPAYGPDIYRDVKGILHAKKRGLVALRGEGLVEMTGTKRTARYTLTAKGKAKLQKKKAPAAAAASAPSPEPRAARRLRRSSRQTGRRRHRR